ncbi:hypothetical protein [Anabaena azotica]|uniref:Uncharacterized protein n=1 Tax=Anabaena azotica FACHB-119 TaxID=947527 RepID=A0ABR8DAI2_9NOST|nr:hypothetical protein [Anabaena azotica]MBD2503151.1 hypothetical protein [Anabaena azotica FACHB-119]
MHLKSITYRRVLNPGNYENKHLELFAEVSEGEDEDAAILHLMELTERNIRSQIGKQFQKQILDLEAQKNNLDDQVYYLKREVAELQKIKAELEKLQPQQDNSTQTDEPNPDNIPFDEGASSPETNINEGF